MLNALLGAAGLIVKKPAILLPALVAVAINLALMLAAGDFLFGFLYDAFIFGSMPEGSLLQMPFFIISMYPAQVLVVAVLALALYATTAWLAVVYGHAAGTAKKGKMAVISSVSFAAGRIGGILALAVFVFLISLAYGIIMLSLIWLLMLPGMEIPAIVLMAAWFLFGIYLLLRVLFLPVVMGVEQAGLKGALGIVWKWGRKHNIGMVALVFALFLITLAMDEAGAAIGGLAGDEMLSLAVAVLFALLNSAYFSLALAKYYAGSSA